jgi:NADH-quinone oxidoreductase subunit C
VTDGSVGAADPRALVRERFGLDASGAPPRLSVDVPLDRWVDFARFAKRELGCHYFSFLTAVDWKELGLEVLYRVENLDDHLDVTVRTKLGPGADHCPSLTDVYRGADWMERECYDMFGITFDGHPDLRRILLAQDWDGHPLRKAYAVDTPHAPYR